MTRATPIRIELNEHMSEIVESAVEAGEFASPDDVVSAALTEWKVNRLLANFAPGEIDALIQEALDSGEPIDGEEAFADIERQLERHIASKSA
ncbi:ribbon-helix-helix domain-containing protein [Rhizobium sp. SAFR-030]|uniref:ribbon-helix-helix domain-containing protein n=1 Tax=Rhizobium sp. SAFR-030 TaxID=3387277 RepID=UPI003F7DC306